MLIYSGDALHNQRIDYSPEHAYPSCNESYDPYGVFGFDESYKILEQRTAEYPQGVLLGIVGGVFGTNYLGYLGAAKATEGIGIDHNAYAVDAYLTNIHGVLSEPDARSYVHRFWPVSMLIPHEMTQLPPYDEIYVDLDKVLELSMMAPEGVSSQDIFDDLLSMFGVDEKDLLIRDRTYTLSWGMYMHGAINSPYHWLSFNNNHGYKYLQDLLLRRKIHGLYGEFTTILEDPFIKQFLESNDGIGINAIYISNIIPYLRSVVGATERFMGTLRGFQDSQERDIFIIFGMVNQCMSLSEFLAQDWNF